MTKRDITIYFAGLVTGDFLMGIWAYSAGIPSINVFGMSVPQQYFFVWMVIDVVIFSGLIYYAKINSKKKKK